MVRELVDSKLVQQVLEVVVLPTEWLLKEEISLEQQAQPSHQTFLEALNSVPLLKHHSQVSSSLDQFHNLVVLAVQALSLVVELEVLLLQMIPMLTLP